MGSTVVCTASHPVDLDDGRSLPPGETAEDVDLGEGNNQGLVDSGQLTVVSEKAKTRHQAQGNTDQKED